MNPLANIENICFFDTETRAEDGTGPSDGSVVTAGTYRYFKTAFTIISTFAIGNGPLFEVSLDRGFDGDLLCWDEMPYELREFHKRVEQREAWYAAFNAGFDRNAWNSGTVDWPLLEPENIIDMMAQATSSNLPPSLEGASRAINRHGKHVGGKKLIELFCSPGGATPQSEPVKWRTFKDYGLIDTDEMREVYRHTRALPFEEWEDYWVSERINERGIGIDLPTVERAARIADLAAERDGKLLTKWTDGTVTAVTQGARIAKFLYDRLPAKAAMLLVKEWDEGENEVDLVAGKLGVDRDRLDKLVAFFTSLEGQRKLTEREQLMYDIAVVRQFGGSTSPFKFEKMLAQHTDGRLRGSYVFNGAAQTGRFSSKGVQVHNLTRSTLGDHEAAAIEMINELTPEGE